MDTSPFLERNPIQKALVKRSNYGKKEKPRQKDDRGDCERSS